MHNISDLENISDPENIFSPHRVEIALDRSDLAVVSTPPTPATLPPLTEKTIYFLKTSDETRLTHPFQLRDVISTQLKPDAFLAFRSFFMA